VNDAVEFCGVKLKNRSVLASGILGVTIASLRRVYNEGAGIVTTKSIGPVKRKGHHSPVVYDWGEGLINAVGLSNPGIDGFLDQYGNEKIDFPLIVSIFGEKVDDFPFIAERLKSFSFNFLELNISCPNVQNEFGTPFSFSEDLTGLVVESVKAVTDKPVIVKLSPGYPELAKIALAAERAGADALNIMNTVGPGMVINTSTARPVLGNYYGGLSGRAILPITVKHIYDLYKEVSVPLIATGGISDPDGALQVLMAGARLYGVGSAVYSRGVEVFRDIEKGINEFLKANNFTGSEEIIGLAQKEEPGKTYYRIKASFKAEEHEHDKKPRFFVLPVKRIEEYRGRTVRTISFDYESNVVPSPGQFFMLWIPGIDQKPYSVSRFDGRQVSFSFTVRGRFSGSLAGSSAGDPVGLLGPLGKGFDLSRDNYILIGGGIGLAPIAFAAFELIRHSKRVTLIAGGKSLYDIEWFNRLFRKGEMKGFQSKYYCTEDGSLGMTGTIIDHLEKIIDEIKPGFALVCGPEQFLKKAVGILEKNGIDGEASIERMMKCGIGICGSCSLDDGGERVCIEGPVFPFSGLKNINEFGKYRRDESGMREGI